MGEARQEERAEASAGAGVPAVGHGKVPVPCAEKGVAEAAGVHVWALASHLLSGSSDPTT